MDDNEQPLLAGVEQATFAFENVSDLFLVAHNDPDNIGSGRYGRRAICRVRPSANHFIHRFRTRIEHCR
jgi:hypothetical protein